MKRQAAVEAERRGHSVPQRAHGIPGYRKRKEDLQASVRASPQKLRIRKETPSHLFRYNGRPRGPLKTLSLAHFDHVLDVDCVNCTLDVEGATTYETVVRHTLPYGLIPTVTPELKCITVGGAISGIGIESSGFRHGFVHDGLLEADVLLANGETVTCTPENAHRELFAALPNSYGTLGYVLRAKVALIPALPYVHVNSARLDSIESFLAALLASAEDQSNDFVEGLFYSSSELYVICGRFTAEASELSDIYGPRPYHTWLRAGRREWRLKTEDYIFRYDPDWFWNVPEGGIYSVFRRLAPRSLRHSAFYKRYVEHSTALRTRLTGKDVADPNHSQLIQDWEVPWSRACELTQYALEHVDLGGRPWVAVPIRAKKRATLYPLEPGCLYFNLGCYCWTKIPVGKERFYYTKLLDSQCFQLGGIKMLYSSTFLNQKDFDRAYNGEAYRKLKEKYDPEGRTPTLYEKVSGLA